MGTPFEKDSYSPSLLWVVGEGEVSPLFLPSFFLF